MTRLLIMACFLLANSLALADSHAVFGRFATEDGNSHIDISDCGDGSPCGTIVWIDPASLEEGQTPESLKTRSTGEPIVGLTMLSEFERASKDWREGTIYSPKADKTFKSRLKRLEDGNLEVKGCIGFICQTQIWSPAP